MQKPVNHSLPNGMQNALPEGFFRIGPLTGLPGIMRDLGCDPDLIFASAGFNSADFAEPDFEIPFVSGSKLLAHCVTATGCEHLGLLLAKRAVPSSLGIAGFMLQAAPDVGTALRDLVNHLDLHDRGAVVSMGTDDRRTFLTYTIHLTGVEATDQINDLSMAVACKIMRTLCGARWKPIEVRLARQAPQNLVPYQQFFRSSLRFGADQSAMVFLSRWMGHQIVGADPLLHRHLEKEASNLHAHQQTSFTATVRQLVRNSLATREIAVADIAKLLHIHERTLNRKLREEGTTFRKELEEVRHEVARQLVANGKIPMSKIATALSYTDATAFSRAFKRWSGVTPTEWRTRHRQ